MSSAEHRFAFIIAISSVFGAGGMMVNNESCTFQIALLQRKKFQFIIETPSLFFLASVAR